MINNKSNNYNKTEVPNRRNSFFHSTDLFPNIPMLEAPANLKGYLNMDIAPNAIISSVEL